MVHPLNHVNFQNNDELKNNRNQKRIFLHNASSAVGRVRWSNAKRRSSNAIPWDETPDTGVFDPGSVL